MGGANFVSSKPSGRFIVRWGRRFFSLLDIFISLFLAFSVASLFVLQFILLQIDAPGVSGKGQVIVIPKGAGGHRIAAELRRHGVIRDPLLFKIGIALRQVKSRLQAGEFFFPERVSVNGVLDILVKGEAVYHEIMIPEGLSSAEIVDLIKENDVLEGQIEKFPSEGTLLPNTYRFTRGMSRQALLSRMQSAQQQALDRIWRNRADGLPFKSPQELVIMASIVEKETGKSDERSRVAAVFINRLKKSMRLQADPTVIYGLTRGQKKMERELLRADVRQETPYNTYKIPGLPPTAISNPGLASLEATANPLETNDLYFVADGTGGHVFASTLDEHNRNVANWRKIRGGSSSTKSESPN